MRPTKAPWSAIGPAIAALALVALSGCGLLGSAEGDVLAGRMPTIPMATMPANGVMDQFPFPDTERFVPGWEHLHSYSNHTSAQWNECGQAAAAMILDHAELDPLNLPLTVADPADNRMHPDNDAFIDGLAKQDPPDVAFGLAGTSPQRLAQTLDADGMKAQVEFGDASGDLTGLQLWTDAGWPAAALVDGGTLWGKTLEMHWVVVYKIDDQDVYVGNPMAGNGVIPVEEFLKAWETPLVPIHYAAVVAELPSTSQP